MQKKLLRGYKQKKENEMSDVVVAHKSTIRRWIEKIADETGSKVVKSHAAELAYTLRQMGEGGAVGCVLGAVDAEFGLDVKGVPMDLVASAVGVGGAMYFATEDFSHDLRNVGSHSFTVFSFRKTKELMQKVKTKIGEEEESTTSDIGEEDPVVQAARDL